MHTIVVGTKVSLVVALACAGICSLAVAQGMDEGQMQKMMQNAEKMQACMSQVDKSAMEAMARDAQAFQEKIKALCAAGKRKQAMSDAMAYGKQVNASADMKKMRECSKYMEGMMPDIPVPDPENEGGSHICDE
jgi:predicted lipoprotein